MHRRGREPSLQCGAEVGRRLPAALGVTLECATQHAAQGLVDLRREIGRQRQVFARHALHGAVRLALDDEPAAAEQLGEHDADGKQVHRRRRQAAAGGLGRHVAGRADDLVEAARIVQAAGDAEVHHPRTAARGDEHVRRLEVAVDDARGVGRMQRVEHAEHERGGLVRRQGATRLDQLRERRAGDVLEHEVGLALLHVGFEHRHDIRVRQTADAARLAQPLAHGDRIDRRVGMHQLDGDLALEALVEAEPHRCLGALAQYAAEFEAAESAGRGRARRGRHGGHEPSLSARPHAA